MDHIKNKEGGGSSPEKKKQPPPPPAQEPGMQRTASGSVPTTAGAQANSLPV